MPASLVARDRLCATVRLSTSIQIILILNPLLLLAVGRSTTTVIDGNMIGETTSVSMFFATSTFVCSSRNAQWGDCPLDTKSSTKQTDGNVFRTETTGGNVLKAFRISLRFGVGEVQRVRRHYETEQSSNELLHFKWPLQLTNSCMEHLAKTLTLNMLDRPAGSLSIGHHGTVLHRCHVSHRVTLWSNSPDWTITWGYQHVIIPRCTQEFQVTRCCWPGAYGNRDQCL